MAVLSLFEGIARDGRTRGARGRATDLGRLSREGRLEVYLGACRVLGIDPAAQPLRFVRCTDGRLRLFDPSRAHQTPAPAPTGTGLKARLERELATGSAAVAAGGGITYEIDLATGDLRVRDVMRASHRPAPLDVAASAPRRRNGSRQLAAPRAALRTAPAR
jgi:hypothetical protein